MKKIKKLFGKFVKSSVGNVDDIAGEQAVSQEGQEGKGNSLLSQKKVVIGIGTVILAGVGFVGYSFLGGSGDELPVQTVAVGNSNQSSDIFEGSMYGETESKSEKAGNNESIISELETIETDNTKVELSAIKSNSENLQKTIKASNTEGDTRDKNKKMNRITLTPDDVDYIFKKFIERKIEQRRAIKQAITEIEKKTTNEVPVTLNQIPVIVEDKKKKLANQTVSVKIRGIACSYKGCKAFTNIGVIEKGDKISNSEKVVAVTNKGIKTNKRFIEY